MFAVLHRENSPTHSFWWLQTLGWSSFYLLSISVVLPYIRRPGELGYEGIKGLFWDQGLMCLCGFLASLALRPFVDGYYDSNFRGSLWKFVPKRAVSQSESLLQS